MNNSYPFSLLLPKDEYLHLIKLETIEMLVKDFINFANENNIPEYERQKVINSIREGI